MLGQELAHALRRLPGRQQGGFVIPSHSFLPGYDTTRLERRAASIEMKTI
jgi:hypothetical protein